MECNVTYRQKDKGLQAIISYKDSRGKWKQKSKQGFENSRAGKVKAKAWSHKIINELEENLNLSDDYEGITFGDFVDEFLEFKTNSTAYNTLIFYKVSLARFSILNSVELRKITPMMITKMITKMINDNKILSKYYIPLKLLFNSAIKDYNILTVNPCGSIKFNDVAKEKEVLNIAQQNKLMIDLETCKNKNVKFGSIIALKCGLRAGEVLGLTWDCIDLKNGYINVCKQWKKLSKGIFGFGKLKSTNSYRNVPIPINIIPILKEYKSSYPTPLDQRLFDTSYISEPCRRFYRDCGFDISIHQLRHTYATNLISNGIDFKTAAYFMGHTVEMTMRIYSHITDDMLDKAKNIINNF